MGKFDLKRIQDILQQMDLDAWIFFDFRGSNQLAHEILDIKPGTHLTRRFFYVVPREGLPKKIINGIEAFHLDHLPGEKLTYSSHESLKAHLANALKNIRTAALEYSPMCAIPYVSRVDAGTVEFLKSFGIELKSSGDLISMFSAVWSIHQFEENKTAADALYDIVSLSFELIGNRLRSGQQVSEYDVQKFIMSEFERRGMVTDSDAIVAVNANSANPHYAPDSTNFSMINQGDFVLIDLWAKMNTPDAVMADITWVGYAGSEVPQKYKDIFDIVASARDHAFELCRERFRLKQPVRGYELDDAARGIIAQAGYGDYFIHRTGHSITTETHGSGAHLDNFETRDERLILPSTSFSIEPGIYLTGDFGVRLEIDVYVSPDGEVISTGRDRQREIVAIMKNNK